MTPILDFQGRQIKGAFTQGGSWISEASVSLTIDADSKDGGGVYSVTFHDALCYKDGFPCPLLALHSTNQILVDTTMPDFPIGSLTCTLRQIVHHCYPTTWVADLPQPGTLIPVAWFLWLNFLAQRDVHLISGPR